MRITVRNCCRVVFEERNVAKEGVIVVLSFLIGQIV